MFLSRKWSPFDVLAYWSFRFNGAGMFLSRKYHAALFQLRHLTLLQWGRDVSIPEMLARIWALACRLGFNGAGMFLSRKSDVPGCRKGGQESFNGAGMFLSRKFRIGNDCDSAVRASMGPGCFYPGNGRRSTCWRTGHFTSMGPGCFYPGNGAVHVGQAVGIELQWGRDVSIPEMSVGFWLLLRCNRFNGAGMFLSRK